MAAEPGSSRQARFWKFAIVYFGILSQEPIRNSYIMAIIRIPSLIAFHLLPVTEDCPVRSR